MEARLVGDGRYRLRRRIGTGGTADVFEADDLQLHRTVAVKLLHTRIIEDEELAARLKAEVDISRGLSHAGIVEVYDYWPGAAEDTEAFLVMEYMGGGDLRRRLLSVGSLPGGEVERISRALLGALDGAHSRGIVHRDLKPRNVLFASDGEPKIADFGLARSLTGAGFFQRGTIAGTPEYTAPETITASIWDPRSDLYALGCTLFEAATGSPPFVANTPAEVLRMQVETEAPPLPDELSASYPHLSRLVAALLSKDPNGRPQTATEALQMLDEAVSAAATIPTEPCPSCGNPMSIHYGWCFTCGRPNLPVRRDSDGYTILVTGPGKAGEKVAPEFRDACCEVAEAAGLDPAGMRKQVPRLPFVLARQVDYGGAVRLSDELRTAGAQVTLIGKGEAPRSELFRAVGRKALTMTPRVYLVILGMGGAWFNIVRSVPPGVLLLAFATLVASVPFILTASFSRSSSRWTRIVTGRGGPNVTRLLATVRDPLIHARMKSMAEAVQSLTAHAGEPADGADTAAVERWAGEMIERTAGLCLALDAIRASRLYAQQALNAPVEARSAAAELRSADALYNRTLELVGRSALDVRELAVRSARAGGKRSKVDLGRLAAIVERFSDEGAAWRDLERPGEPS